MKKLSICITCIIALVLGVSGSAYSESGKWKKYEQGGKRTEYQYPSTGCMVTADTSENGYVNITATDSDPGDFRPGGKEEVYTQGILVKKLPSGIIRRTESYTHGVRVVPGSKESKDYKKAKNYKGYDIFGSRCVGYAKELPEDVQKLFYGFYGIGSE